MTCGITVAHDSHADARFAAAADRGHPCSGGSSRTGTRNRGHHQHDRDDRDFELAVAAPAQAEDHERHRSRDQPAGNSGMPKVGDEVARVDVGDRGDECRSGQRGAQSTTARTWSTVSAPAGDPRGAEAPSPPRMSGRPGPLVPWPPRTSRRRGAVRDHFHRRRTSGSEVDHDSGGSPGGEPRRSWHCRRGRTEHGASSQAFARQAPPVTAVVSRRDAPWGRL